MKYSKLSTFKIKKILHSFCLELTAVQTAKQLELNRKTVDYYYNRFRVKIAGYQESQNIKLSGKIEIDESYFGARRIRGKRGRGASDKIPVLGILKRNGKVSVTIIDNCSRSELLPIIQGKVLSKTKIYTDGWRAYDGLITLGYKHYRIHHHEDEFARGKNHVNGIESFWSFTKRRLRKFNGIQKTKFLLHLKESEYRWNMREAMYTELLKSLKQNPL